MRNVELEMFWGQKATIRGGNGKLSRRKFGALPAGGGDLGPVRPGQRDHAPQSPPLPSPATIVAPIQNSEIAIENQILRRIRSNRLEKHQNSR
jgi:hypothetical protein